MPLFDFVCPAGHVTEALRSSSVTVIDCACGEIGQRRDFNRVAVRVGESSDWSSPVRDNGRIRTPVNERRIHLRQYDEATQELEHAHRKQEESAGHALPTPGLADIAIKRANQLMKAGITDSLDMPK